MCDEEDSDQMVQCKTWKSWIHYQCDEINEDNINADDQKYKCHNCRGKNTSETKENKEKHRVTADIEMKTPEITQESKQAEDVEHNQEKIEEYPEEEDLDLDKSNKHSSKKDGDVVEEEVPKTDNIDGLEEENDITKESKQTESSSSTEETDNETKTMKEVTPRKNNKKILKTVNRKYQNLTRKYVAIQRKNSELKVKILELKAEVEMEKARGKESEKNIGKESEKNLEDRDTPSKRENKVKMSSLEKKLEEARKSNSTKQTEIKKLKENATQQQKSIDELTNQREGATYLRVKLEENIRLKTEIHKSLQVISKEQEKTITDLTKKCTEFEEELTQIAIEKYQIIVQDGEKTDEPISTEDSDQPEALTQTRRQTQCTDRSTEPTLVEDADQMEDLREVRSQQHQEWSK